MVSFGFGSWFVFFSHESAQCPWQYQPGSWQGACAASRSSEERNSPREPGVDSRAEEAPGLIPRGTVSPWNPGGRWEGPVSGWGLLMGEGYSMGEGRRNDPHLSPWGLLLVSGSSAQDPALRTEAASGDTWGGAITSALSAVSSWPLAFGAH